MNALETALQWRALGIATIPILAGSKRPACPWKRYQSEMPSITRLKAWFGGGGYNLAVVCGWRGLAVVDWDDVDEMCLWQTQLLLRNYTLYTLATRTTYMVRTRSGFHLYLFTNEQLHNWHGDGVDVKVAGGYVVAPPSIHPSGFQYQAVGSPADIQRISSIRELLPQYKEPKPIIPIIDDYDRAWRATGGGNNYAQVALAGELDRLAQARQGGRNNTLCRCAFRIGQLLADLDRTVVKRELLAGALAIGLPEWEARATIESGLTAGEANPR